MPTWTGTTGDDTISKSTATVSWTLNGGAGNDTITGGTVADVLNGGSGNDYLYGRAGDDTVKGGAGDDWVQGDAGVDYLYGEANNDTLAGGDGADYLYGGAGVDTIFGQAGDDRIYGGDGDDTLWGQTGANRFYFEAPTNPDSYDPTDPYTDTIKDFVDGTDKIYIVTDAGLSPTWSVETTDTDSDGVADDTKMTITFYPDDTTASATPIYVNIENVVSTSITNADVVFA